MEAVQLCGTADYSIVQHDSSFCRTCGVLYMCYVNKRRNMFTSYHCLCHPITFEMVETVEHIPLPPPPRFFVPPVCIPARACLDMSAYMPVPMVLPRTNRPKQTKFRTKKSRSLSATKIVKQNLLPQFDAVIYSERQQSSIDDLTGPVHVTQIPQIESETSVSAVPDGQQIESEASVSAVLDVQQIEPDAFIAAVPDVQQIESEASVSAVPDVQQIESEASIAPVTDVQQIESEASVSAVPDVQQIESEASIAPVTNFQQIESEASVSAVPSVRQVELEVAKIYSDQQIAKAATYLEIIYKSATANVSDNISCNVTDDISENVTPAARKKQRKRTKKSKKSAAPQTPEITETPEISKLTEVVMVPKITETPEISKVTEVVMVPETPEMAETPTTTETPPKDLSTPKKIRNSKKSKANKTKDADGKYLDRVCAKLEGRKLIDTWFKSPLKQMITEMHKNACLAISFVQLCYIQPPDLLALVIQYIARIGHCLDVSHNSISYDQFRFHLVPADIANERYQALQVAYKNTSILQEYLRFTFDNYYFSEVSIMKTWVDQVNEVMHTMYSCRFLMDKYLHQLTNELKSKSMLTLELQGEIREKLVLLTVGLSANSKHMESVAERHREIFDGREFNGSPKMMKLLKLSMWPSSKFFDLKPAVVLNTMVTQVWGCIYDANYSAYRCVACTRLYTATSKTHADPNREKMAQVALLSPEICPNSGTTNNYIVLPDVHNDYNPNMSYRRVVNDYQLPYIVLPCCGTQQLLCVCFDRLGCMICRHPECSQRNKQVNYHKALKRHKTEYPKFQDKLAAFQVYIDEIKGRCMQLPVASKK